MFSSCFGASGDDVPARASLITGDHNIITTNEKVLLDIVGALGLSMVKDCVNSFCTVSVNQTKKHMTSIIYNDTSPIWTVETNSLCLLGLQGSDKITVNLWSSSRIGFSQAICGVTLDFATMVEGKGNRIEFELLTEENALVTLALRFRKATENDLSFFSGTNDPRMIWPPRLGPGVDDSVGDIDFKNVEKKKLFQQTTRSRQSFFIKGKEEKKYRVWPFPDPDDPSTEWMTKQQMKDAALEPSKQWYDVGHGKYGAVYLEIIGCDDLPNMDTELIDGLTDAFVAIVFEDCYVRTSVIHDSLNPRWMPWADRAFKFNIAHPSSILRLGVFDFDDVPINGHDPISRIEIHPESFESDTLYTLQYPLHQGTLEDGSERAKGTITIRLRIHWNNIAEVNSAFSFGRPPRFFVNVDTEKSWRVVRYLTRGPVDQQEVSVKSLKLYVQEILGHWKQFCYLLDVLAEILLWRGSMKLELFSGRQVSVWCPIHSAYLLLSVMYAVEHPDFAPAVFLYGIAYTLLWKNYHLSTHPNPFCRVKSFRRFMGRFTYVPQQVHIEPGTGKEDAEVLRLLDEYKANRVMVFMYEASMICLSLYRVYNKSIPPDLSTVKTKENFLSALYLNYLSHVIKLCRVLCKKVRLVRNFVNWRAQSTYKFTVVILVLATSWWIFPYKHLIVPGFKVCIFIVLGPHLKILDILWVQKYYRTKEQLFADGLPACEEEMKQDISNRANILDFLLSSSWIRELGKSGRIVSEENLKLSHFRKGKYGKFSEHVHYNASVFPSIPLPSSIAEPYAKYRDLPQQSQTWSRIAGQKLEGNMVYTTAQSSPSDGPIKKEN
eukprot:scaffold15472_cov117-Cylindrotheca_fusiformis.AAC.22